LNDSPDDPLLDSGRNCWSECRAGQVGWAIDGEAYFGAFRDSIEKAEHEILIVGWDIDSRVELIRDPEDPRYPSPLRETPQSLVERKSGLKVYVLSWDFAMVYVLERELLPASSFGWQDSERLHFKLDDRHVTGASQHQKVVVIDGALAFIGGFDITKHRWDTQRHAAGDARRSDPSGESYRPFHDVQAVVSGECAGRLRELVDWRWRNATGDSLPPLEHEDDGSLCWPENIEVRARNARAALARTWVDPETSEVTAEVEALYLDMIGRARKSLYIENQYFTSQSIAGALADSLRRESGPEIVLVLPGRTSGWLEQSTMDVLRNQALTEIAEADEHGRLRIVSPVSDELGDTAINVHGKVMVVDDRWLRIGSANLSRRSMGLDSECDLVVEDAEAAARLRAELIAEHLGADVEAVQSGIAENGLLGTLDEYNGGNRRLDPLSYERDDWDALLEPLARIADLEKPIERSWSDTVDSLGNRLNGGPDGTDGPPTRREADSSSETNSTSASPVPLPTPTGGWIAMAVIVAVLGFWIFWMVRGASMDLSAQELLDRLQEITAHPLAPFIAFPAFVASSLLVAPVTWMIALCALLFEPVVASLVAIAGTLAATALNHFIGARFADAISSRIPQGVAGRIKRLASSSDTWSLAGLRLIPIAPFTIVNLAVGVAGVPLRPFLLGTLIAMAPGTLLLCFSVDRARAALRGEQIFDPWIVAIIVLAGVGLIGLRILRNRMRK